MRVTLIRDHPAEGWRSMDRYAEALCAALASEAPPSWQIEMPAPPDPGSGVYRRLATRMLRYPAWARGQAGDVNHVLDHSYGHLVGALDPVRSVVTVHDIAPLHFPGRRFGISAAVWRRAFRGAARARHVIAVSEFAAGELRSQLDPARVRIHVVPQGVDDRFRPPTVEKRAAVRQTYVDEGDPLLLHVGRIHARKNLGALLDAVARLRAGGEPVRLVQVGGDPSPELTRRLRAPELEGVVHFAGQVSDEALVGLYGAADVLVFPSLYEGFGLPVLEAMACGTPVVASDAASLPEVVGDAGLTAASEDPEALAAAVRRVLHEPGLAETLRARGLERAHRFSWRETARGTLAVYEACIAELDRPASAGRV